MAWAQALLTPGSGLREFVNMTPTTYENVIDHVGSPLATHCVKLPSQFGLYVFVAEDEIRTHYDRGRQQIKLDIVC